MCGRGRCTLRPDDFSRACHLTSRPVRHLDMDRYRPSYNVAPGFSVPVVRRDDGGGGGDGVVLHCMKWGLVPGFTKKTDKIDHFRMFNARSESISEKASFRRLLPKNRCLVSFEGFYEWKKDGSKKQPYYIHLKDGRPLDFAALYDSWKNAEGEILYTFTIITTSSSSSSLEWLHDRMPVILGSKESTECWLNDASLSNLDKILKPYEDTDLAWYPVTPAMGKISFDGPECIKEIQVKTEETKTISQFFSKKQASNPEEQEHEKKPIKEELQEHIAPKTEKGEPQNLSISETTMMKDEEASATKEQKKAEIFVSIEHKSVKEEPHSQEESVAQIDESDTKNTDHVKPFAKETGRPHSSPVNKRRKATNDKQSRKGSDGKQPTLFSYFVKN